jgi:FkbM family methyltransferase
LLNFARSLREVLLSLHPRRAAKRRLLRQRAMFFAQFLNSGALCFDVGANAGQRTEVFLNLGARVVAIEPNAGCVAALRSRYGQHPDVVIVPKGLDTFEGTQQYFNSSFAPMSSMSVEWMKAVQDRYEGVQWEPPTTIEVTTLDALITQFGIPRFCKIDVEGYELQVLSGLSQPVPALSFECTPELLANATACIERLSVLGEYEYNYSIGESMKMALPAWTTREEMLRILTDFPAHNIYSDIYARLKST